MSSELDDESGPYACPACLMFGLYDRDSADLCAVCLWEDGGDWPNGMTVQEYRAKFYTEFNAPGWKLPDWKALRAKWH